MQTFIIIAVISLLALAFVLRLQKHSDVPTSGSGGSGGAGTPEPDNGDIEKPQPPLND